MSKSKKLISLATMMTLFTACGGGGGAGSDSGSRSSADEILSKLTTGYSVPKSISAIPADSSGSFAAAAAKSAPRSLGGLRQALNSSSESDYDRAGNLELKVSEPALDQFSIIDTILSVLRQTNYWDSSVINKGAYKTLVRWEENHGDGADYQNWIINSRMIVLNGKDVNRVRFWIEDEGVKGKIDIFSAPSSSNTYGEWRLDVELPDVNNATGSFTAEANLQDDGHVKLSLNQDNTWPAKGILYLKNGEGYGVMEYPDEDSCNTDDCDPPTISAKMAYNDDYAIIQNEGEEARCKSRESFSDLYLDYAIFDSTGKNVNKTKVFGFPVTYRKLGLNPVLFNI